MVRIKPFRGLRPQPGLEAKIASKPYDVLNSEEARKEAEGNPYSFLHVVKSEIDLPGDLSPYDSRVYEKAAENLRNFIQKKWLIRDEKPVLYLYGQQMKDHTQYGLVAAVHVDDYLEGNIKIHELTREEKEKDRIRHVETTNANTGPVFLTYQASDFIDRIVEKVRQEKPVYHFTAPDEVTHSLWIIKDHKILQALRDAFEALPCAYVADGHHRSKSAAMVGKKRREANPTHTGEEEYNWFLAVFFPHNHLKILDYNRIVKDLNGLSEKEFLKKVSQKFDVKKVCCAQAAKPTEKHRVGMYLKGEWYTLKARPGTFDESDPVERLDVSVLHRNLLTPILNIGDPRTDDRVDFVGGIRGLTELEKRVDSGDMAVAFALYPTSVEELMAIADAGKLMPPKSTWFEPKLRSGLIIHTLDD
ncbi:MAG: hypothetical protein PWP06_132 [Candidatus Marinimicrobia bacterium]|jgi:uncharacterized protein (DUF1015 family)|nr:hypothetical protein [Candidatus Neomarinimicrobiota bacterium]